MSFVHHEPDLAEMPCVCCGRLVAEPDLVKDDRHFGRSCCNWHPYHRWCTVEQERAPRRLDECVECAGRIHPELLAEGFTYLEMTIAWVHLPLIGPLAFKRILWQGRMPPPPELPLGFETPRREHLLSSFAPLHRDCLALARHSQPSE